MNEEQEKQVLVGLKTWDIVEEQDSDDRVSCCLHRMYMFKDFDVAYCFMCKAAEEIIKPQNHHPRWENTYNRVEIWLTTFDANKQITEKDIRMAKALEKLWLTFQQG